MITSSFQKVSCPLWLLRSSGSALLGPAVLSGYSPPGAPCSAGLWSMLGGHVPISLEDRGPREAVGSVLALLRFVSPGFFLVSGVGE